MKKYIKLNGNKIIEVRPLIPEQIDEETNEVINKEIIKLFDKEFLKLDVPDGVSELDLLRDYRYDDGKFYKTNETLDIIKLQEELLEINDWLLKNDWVPNKIITGEWAKTDARWKNYLNDRKSKRARQDVIKEALGV